MLNLFAISEDLKSKGLCANFVLSFDYTLYLSSFILLSLENENSLSNNLYPGSGIIIY